MQDKTIIYLNQQYRAAPDILKALTPNFTDPASQQLATLQLKTQTVTALGNLIENYLKDLQAAGLSIDSPAAWFLVKKGVLLEWEEVLGGKME